MKGVTTARGLSDLRTAISTRVRATPRMKGTSYLEMYQLSMERQRLASELARIDHRRGRISERMGEIDKHLAGFDQGAIEARARTQGDGEATGEAPRTARGAAPVASVARGRGATTQIATPGNRTFRKMTVGY